MENYRLVFVKNELISCELIMGSVPDFVGKYYYEQARGQLIFAIVKADSTAEAVDKAGLIVAEMTEKVLGNDFVT